MLLLMFLSYVATERNVINEFDKKKILLELFY